MLKFLLSLTEVSAQTESDMHLEAVTDCEYIFKFILALQWSGLDSDTSPSVRTLNCEGAGPSVGADEDISLHKAFRHERGAGDTLKTSDFVPRERAFFFTFSFIAQLKQDTLKALSLGVF